MWKRFLLRSLIWSLIMIPFIITETWGGDWGWDYLTMGEDRVRDESSQRKLRERVQPSLLDQRGIMKVLLVEVRSGLGNRISSIASSAILAFLMNRVMVIDWVVDEGCGTEMEKLFEVSDVRNNEDDKKTL